MKTTLRALIALCALLSTAAHAEVHTVKVSSAVMKATGLTTDTLTVTTGSPATVVQVSAVALSTDRHKFLTCEHNGGQEATANRAHIGGWETFIKLDFLDGTVAFRTTKGNYLVAQNGGGAWVKCTSTQINAAERWQPSERPDGTYTFRAASGHYLSIAGNVIEQAVGLVRAHRASVGATETFEVIDLGIARMAAMPGISLKFADLDGDAQKELVLVVEEANGHGFFMIDPLGIVDLMGKLGYGTGQGFDIWDTLSPTQRAALRLQANSVGSYGNELDSAELAALLARFPANGSRTYPSYQFEREIETYRAGTCHGDLCTEVVIGNDRLLVECDEFGPGFELSTNVATLSLTNGVVTASVSVGSVAAAANVDKDGFTFGASVDLISVSVGLGKENGTYVGVSAGVGVGFWADAKYGKNGQYGFSLGVPMVPVGVAIYIKGSDAAWVYNQVNTWTVDSALTVAEGTQRAWALAMTWAAQSDENIQIVLTATNRVAATTRRSTYASLQIAGNTAVGSLSDGTRDLLKVYVGAANTVSASATRLTDGVNNVTRGVNNAMKHAIDSVGSTAASVGKAVAGGICDVFGC